MPLDQENFEKFESFIDGTLDAHERDQVQAMLADNPQLQKMMAELLAQRGMLRNLPRAQAPEELLESFQGQLEREALLGGPMGESKVARSVERWPYMVLVAAIVFLVFGLAGLIYEVLPKHRDAMPLVYGPGVGVNMGLESEPAPTTQPLTTEPVVKADVESILPKAIPTTVESVVALGNLNNKQYGANHYAATETTPTPLAVAIGENDRAQMDIAELRQMQEKLNSESPAAAGSTNEPVVILVNSAHPVQADAEISQFLQSNFIAYDIAPTADYENGSVPQRVRLEGARSILNGGQATGGGQAIQQQVQQNQQKQAAAEALPVTLPSAPAEQQNAVAPRDQSTSGLAFRNQLGANAAPGQIVYRVTLTQQQIEQLNKKLLDQQDQWTQVHGQVISDALPPNAMQNAMTLNRVARFELERGVRREDNAKDIWNKVLNGPATTQSSVQVNGSLSSELPSTQEVFPLADKNVSLAPATQPTTLATTGPASVRTYLIIVNAAPTALAPATAPISGGVGAATAPVATTQETPASQP